VEREAHVSTVTIPVRALQLGESLDTKGLERQDAFSTNPLAFQATPSGTAILFKYGAAVFVNMSPVEEEQVVHGLGHRIMGPIAPVEMETAQIVVAPAEDDQIDASGTIHLRSLDPTRLLLVGEALAVSVALAYVERRIATAFDRIEPIAASLLQRKLPSGPQSALLEQIGEALMLQKRLAARVDLDDKPDVLWDHPELDRFWGKLVDEYDLPARGLAVERKLVVIRETADTITELLSTRTSHRLEWLVIILIGIEITLALYDHIAK
jgi:uncharacterized Rmd1/YagE family protein